jgi:hypothetical protein
MAWPQRNISWRRFTYRSVACVALVGYLAAAIGFPLPRLPQKDHSRPFPCQDHPCGCQTAEQCWRHCCCFSPEERFVWARAHDVEPPSYAERSAAGGWQTARLCDGVVCTHCGDRQGCQPASGPVQKSCYAKHKDVEPCGAQESSHRSGAKPRVPACVPWLLGVTAMGCQGATNLWLCMGAVLPPIPLTWTESFLPADWLCNRNASSVLLPSIPPEPPPRGFRA